MNEQDASEGNDFLRQASTPAPGLVREFIDFARQNKKWWLLPLVLVLLMFGAMLVFSSSVAAPFIYTLF